MAGTPIERASQLRESVAAIGEWRDPLGVLSVTIGIEPGAGRGGTPPWAIAVENDLACLGQGSFGHAAKQNLEAASTYVSELLDPAATRGLGRALFVALGSRERREIILQQALPTGARLGPVPHVLPLLQALEEGEPAGLIMASKDNVVLCESELGDVTEVDHIELEPWVGDWWPEMKGPSRANPLRGQHTVSQRDRYARRIAVAYRRTLAEACSALGALAIERGWTRAALAGDSRTVGALADALGRAGVAHTIVVRANLEGMRPDDARERLALSLESLATDVSAQRARAAVEAAAAGAKGACGLADVLAALNEARVASVLIDPSQEYLGVEEPDGTLRVSQHGEEAADLTDLIVARALATGARVTPALGAAAEELGSCGGVAVQVRW